MNRISSRLFPLVLLTILAFSGCGGLLGSETAVSTATEAAPKLVEVLTQPTEETAVVDPVPVVQVEPTAVPQPAPVQQTSALDLVLAQQQAFVEVYNRVNPAVVSVNLTQGGGSGFVIDAEAGYIVTNNHVVEQGGPIQVAFADGRTYDARLVGRDPQADLAVLQIDVSVGEITAVPLGDSDALNVGVFVIAIGSPFGLDNTMTTGIVSGLSRNLPAANFGGPTFQIPNVIQTDAAINPGNSGGPLLDLFGNVIGVNTAIESPVRGSSGVGFAVPVNVLKAVVPQLIDGGSVAYPYLGISGGSVADLSAEARNQLGLLATQQGAFISAITAGGPAAAAGLQGVDPNSGLGGDIIVGVDGNAINEFDDLVGFIVQNRQVGDTIQLDVLRGGQLLTIPLTLGERPSSG